MPEANEIEVIREKTEALEALVRELSQRDSNVPLSSAERYMLRDVADLLKFYLVKIDSGLQHRQIMQKVSEVLDNIVKTTGKLTGTEILRVTPQTGEVRLATPEEIKEAKAAGDLPPELEEAMDSALAQHEEQGEEDAPPPLAPDGSTLQ